MKNSLYLRFIFLGFLVLPGCQATSDKNLRVAQIDPPPIPLSKPATPAVLKAKTPSQDYYKIAQQVQCVPHARKVSGIPIRGNAHTWWPQAKGKFERSKHVPHVGSVMVLSKTQRLRYGHLAVVKNIIDNRTIEVEHANWGGNLASRKIVYKRMPVKDASTNNDWSRARFFDYPSKTFGSVYPVSGFILPNTYVTDTDEAIR